MATATHPTATTTLPPVIPQPSPPDHCCAAISHLPSKPNIGPIVSALMPPPHNPLFSFRQSQNIVSFIDHAPLFFMHWRRLILLYSALPESTTGSCDGRLVSKTIFILFILIFTLKSFYHITISAMERETQVLEWRRSEEDWAWGGERGTIVEWEEGVIKWELETPAKARYAIQGVLLFCFILNSQFISCNSQYYTSKRKRWWVVLDSSFLLYYIYSHLLSSFTFCRFNLRKVFLYWIFWVHDHFKIERKITGIWPLLKYY